MLNFYKLTFKNYKLIDGLGASVISYLDVKLIKNIMYFINGVKICLY